ncbi:NAD(P)-binding protein [Nitrosomonas sp.]|uniref:NAD-binding protein n=1 Tax=Nitrosomonas sp. TaxID=42353 RepID=UPI0025DDB722|nr:NAD(P)-binding protein [Nitrosomonas sp.]
MILYSHPLYEWLAPWLKIFERRQPYRENKHNETITDNIPQTILFGLGRYGTGIAQALRERGYRVLSVDYNPELVRARDPTELSVLYGDAEDPEFIASLPLVSTQWIVSTARDHHVSLVLIHTLKNLGYTGRIAVTAHHLDEVAGLEQAGANLVLVPFSDAAREAADRLIEHTT